MKSIEELKAEQAKQLANLEREHAIADAMPTPPHTVHAFSTPWVIYKVKGLRAAVDLFAQFPAVVPCWTALDGCRYLQPLADMKPNAADRIDGGPYAVVLEVETVLEGPGGPGAKLFWWSTAPGFLVCVRVEIEGPGYIGAYWAMASDYREDRSPRGRVVRSRQWKGNTVLRAAADRVFAWATGDSLTRARHSYVWQADHEETADTGADMSHALAMLQNLADELEPVESGK